MFNGCNIAAIAAKKYQPLVKDYLAYLELGQKHFNNPQISTEIRCQKINLLAKALQKNTPYKQGVIYRLQNYFVQENLSITLLLEPLSAWQYTAAGNQPTSGTQVSEILNRLMSPAARLLLVLDNENPSTYLPLTSLFILLFLQEIFIKNSDFIKKAKMSKQQRESRLNGLYKNAAVILALIRSKRLKFKLAILLNTARLHTERMKNNKQGNPTFLDYTLIFLYSLWQFLVIKRKSVNNKGI